jgi:putative endonuclease
MYHVYILENQAGKHYIGYTSNLSKRIKDHNSSKGRWIKRKVPWHLVYQQEYPTKEEAYLREGRLKDTKAEKLSKSF